MKLAAHGHSYSARVARERADAGFCAAKKTRFHGVHLHLTVKRQLGRLPLPTKVWLVEASHHDSKAVKEQPPEIAADALLIHCWGKLAVAFFLLVFYY